MYRSAIQTRYKGYRFRSRTEARWAVCFDYLGIKWEYEKEGYELPSGRYLPDFWLSDLNCFAEVKPCALTRQQFNKCMELPSPCLLLDGMPEAKFYFCCNSIPDQAELGTYEFYMSGDDTGRVLLNRSVNENRLWISFGEPIEDYETDRLNLAITAGRSARFEFGDRP